MIKLTQTQRELLSSAAAAEDGAVDAPKDRKSFVRVIENGLMISVPQGDGGSRLLITEAGRAAVGGERGEPPAEDQPEPAAPPEPTPASAPKGKIGTLVALLRRPEGATIEAMIAATGWQAHSVRGAMSGAVKKGLGLAIESGKTDGVRVYRIQAGVEA